MLAQLANLVLGSRRSGVAGLFDRSRRGGVASAINNNRRMSAFGTVATIAAPFLIRRFLDRRAARAPAL